MRYVQNDKHAIVFFDENDITEATDGGEEVAAPSAEGGSVYWLNFKPEADEALQQITQLKQELK